MNVLEVSRRIKRSGKYLVLASVLLLGTSLLLICLFVVLTILPTSILLQKDKFLELVLNCLWIALPGVTLWLVGWVMECFAKYCP
jgi:Na+-driven multidrug efflux pump